jgi:O-antigen/teichoic acid export membrane protein
LSKVRDLARNAASMGAARASHYFFAFILNVIVARALQVDNFGTYSFVLSFTTIFQMLSFLGINELIVREIAKRKEDLSKLFSSALLIRIISPVFFVGIIYLIVLLADFDDDTSKALMIAGISIIAFSISYLIEGLMVALRQSQHVAAVALGENVIKLVLSVIFLARGYGVVALMVAVLLSRLASILMYAVPVRLVARELRWSLDRATTAQVFRLSWVFALISVFTVVYWRIDQVMLQFFKGPYDVGLYSAAFKILLVLTLFLQAFMISVFPVLSSSYRTNRAEFERISRKALRYLVMVAAPIIAGTLVLAEEIIGLVYGPGYESSANILRFLIPVLLPFFMDGVLWRVVLATDNQIVTLRITSLNMSLNVLFNLILIPRFSYFGAAVATLVTLTTAFGQNARFVTTRLFAVDFRSTLMMPVISAAVMGGVVYLLKYHLLSPGIASLILMVVTGAVCYGVMLLLTKAVSKADLDLLREIRSK